MCLLVAAATLRIWGSYSGRLDRRGWRFLFATIGVALAVLVQQTVERGARLVYEQGVGVITGPPGPGSGPLDGDTSGGAANR